MCNHFVIVNYRLNSCHQFLLDNRDKWEEDEDKVRMKIGFEECTDDDDTVVHEDGVVNGIYLLFSLYLSNGSYYS